MVAQHVAQEELVFQRFADMRYLGQEHTVKVPLPAGQISPESLPEINDRFHRLHEHTYTFRLQLPVEVVNYHLTALGRVEKPALRPLDSRPLSLEGALKGSRLVNFDELGFYQVNIYERHKFPIRRAVPGPLVIEEPASATVVFPDQQITRDEVGFLHIEKSGRA
jgi:N-methylhydantoinase A